MSTWRFATPAMAATLTEQLKALGLLDTRYGAFNSENLLVLEGEGGALDGCMYMVPDSLVTTVSEVYSFTPGLLPNYRKGIEFYLARRPAAAKVVAGFVDVKQATYVNALIRKGGHFKKFCMQVEFYHA